uniref:Uncharacterized protein n=1 Tax=Rhabditophanes sp. KR3021 TaxID=114890 RepID=A0AC35U566_9BILA
MTGAYPIVHAKSILTLPRAREVEREGTVGTLTRVTSVPNLSSLHVNRNFGPSSLYKYRRDTESFEDYWHDRYTFVNPIYWANYRYNARDEINTDPSYEIFREPTSRFYSHYMYNSGYVNPNLCRNYNGRNTARPVFAPKRGYPLDRQNQKLAVTMLKQRLIDFKSVDDNYLTPLARSRKNDTLASVYSPAGTYGPRRYFYSWNC